MDPLIEWSYDLGRGSQFEPHVAGDIVFCGSSSGKLHALDCRSGDHVWSSDLGSPLIRSGCASSRGLLFCGSDHGELFGIVASTGEVAWKHHAVGALRSTPVVDDDCVYFATFAGEVRSLSKLDGSLNWQIQIGAEVASSPSISHGRLIVGAYDYFLYCFGKDGSLIWKTKTEFWCQTSPCCAGMYIYSASHDKMCRFDARDGRCSLQFKCDSEVIASPLLYNGLLVFGGYDGCMYCINASDFTHRWTVRSGEFFVARPQMTTAGVLFGGYDGKLYCVEIATGRTLWTLDFPDAIGESCAVHDGRAFLTCGDGRLYGVRIPQAT